MVFLHQCFDCRRVLPRPLWHFVPAKVDVAKGEEGCYLGYDPVKKTVGALKGRIEGIVGDSLYGAVAAGIFGVCEQFGVGDECCFCVAGYVDFGKHLDAASPGVGDNVADL